MDGTVLVADDDRTIRTVLTQALTRAGCKVHATSSLTTLMRWVAEGMGDLVITDVAMPDGNGLEMLPKIAQDRPNMPVIVISAQNTIMTAIKAAEADAFDYLPKPFDLPDLMKRTAQALGQRQSPAPTTRAPADTLPLVGRSAAMQALYRMVAGVMNAPQPLLITGASGTGKSLLAASVHALSERRDKPLVIADIEDFDAGVNSEIMMRGKGGTIVIEEITDIPITHQSRLVRMLDAGGVDAPRFIATSQVDMAQALHDGLLREDLYYRLSAVQLHLPALSERVDDIGPLVAHFITKMDAGIDVTPEGLEALRTQPWPGNVRQLENTLQQFAITANGGMVTAADVMQAAGTQPRLVISQDINPSEKLGTSVARHLQRYFDLHEGMLPPAGLYQRILREVEGPLIDIALTATSGNQAKCADLLGINRNTLRKKILELDIEVTRRRKLM